MLGLVEEDLTPLLLLEAVLQAKLSLLPGVPSHVNAGLEKIVRRSLWHVELPKSFFAWTFNK